MKAKEFDNKFDQGNKDIIDDLDLSTARRVNQAQQCINIDFSKWVVATCSLFIAIALFLLWILRNTT